MQLTLIYGDALDQLDTALFYWINLQFQSRIMTVLMKFVTESHNFIIPVALTAIFLMKTYRWRGFWFITVAIITVTLNDAICYQILKPFFNRPRPCLELSDAVVHSRCSNNGSFPSNHASNIFTLATIFAGVYKNTIILAFGIASVVGFSRIYLGVHYPLDVFGGAFIGLSIGSLGVYLYHRMIIAK